MKNYVRRTMDVLEGLGFRVDHEDRKIRTDRWIFTHSNAPDERLTLNFDSSETRCRVLEQRAKAIVGLATTETGSASPKARANEKRRQERAAERARIETAHRLADAATLTAYFAVEQVADMTGLTDKAVRRAIDSESLTAYMCGGVIKVKGSDVREWRAAGRNSGKPAPVVEWIGLAS